MIEIPERMVGQIIGKMGSSIRSIEMQSQGSTMRVITLEGHSDAANQAKRLIFAKIEEAEQAEQGNFTRPPRQDNFQQQHQPYGGGGGGYGGGGGGGGYGGGGGGGGGGGTKIIHIPNDTCGRIIGKGGSMIQQLEAQSGARIKMQRENTPGMSTRPLTLEGPPHAMAQAERMIMEKVNEANQRLTGTWKGDEALPRAGRVRRAAAGRGSLRPACRVRAAVPGVPRLPSRGGRPAVPWLPRPAGLPRIPPAAACVRPVAVPRLRPTGCRPRWRRPVRAAALRGVPSCGPQRSVRPAPCLLGGLPSLGGMP
ncbi:hypothetical protein T484DRAFT_3165918 [Baffinella frigidus]|nr:hypothetical protein T484DRAFT_3165918 [Cryptophyta sp. CCMP2293]